MIFLAWILSRELLTPWNVISTWCGNEWFVAGKWKKRRKKIESANRKPHTNTRIIPANPHSLTWTFQRPLKTRQIVYFWLCDRNSDRAQQEETIVEKWNFWKLEQASLYGVHDVLLIKFRILFKKKSTRWSCVWKNKFASALSVYVWWQMRCLQAQKQITNMTF